MTDFDSALKQAQLSHHAGDLDAADRVYRQILESDPQHAAARYLSGLIALQRGNLPAGIKAISAAIAVDNTQPMYHHHLAEAYRAAGDLVASRECLRRALAQFPQSAELHDSLGQTLHELGELPAARDEFETAIRLRPDFATAHFHMGVALKAIGYFAEASERYRQALRIQPNLAIAICGLAHALQQIGSLSEAATEYRRYLQIVPDDAMARFNLGCVLQMLRRLDEATVEYDRSAAIAPPNADQLVQIGTCFQLLGKTAEAAERYRAAIALDAQCNEAHLRLGTVLLASGDFEAGWPEYEWRLRPYARHRSLRVWDGSDLTGASIVVNAEGWQGLGDTLQFVRYASFVRERGAEVVLDVQPPLVRLLKESGFPEVVSTGTSIHPPCDWQVAMMSLPRIFGTRLESIPAEVPYLFVRPEHIAAWNQTLQRRDDFKVGIHWHGSRNAVRDGRAIPLDAFEPLAHTPGVHLFSIQMGPEGSQLRRFANKSSVTDLASEIVDFYDSAAIMCSLDLVITSDSAPAHLAGALGRPVWVALPHSADWRWFTDREDSPWYSTMRLFRQTRVDDWTELFSRIAAELTRLVENR